MAVWGQEEGQSAAVGGTWCLSGARGWLFLPRLHTWRLFYENPRPIDSLCKLLRSEADGRSASFEKTEAVDLPPGQGVSALYEFI